MRVLLLFCCVIVVIILKESLLQPANEVCEGNVFTGVCLSTGERCVSQNALGRGCVSQHALRGCLPRGVFVQGVSAQDGVCPGGCLPGGVADTPTRTRGRPPSRYYGIRSTSRRYASHWNAFLFLIVSSSVYILYISRILICN